jgi:Outer membrane protein beta-barrel domain
VKYLITGLAMCLVAQSALAQNISIGVRAGVPLNDALSAVRSPNFGFSSDRPRYAVGPTFEVRLPLGLGFHVDALYRKIGVTGASPTATGTNSFSFWQFPVMAKLRLGVGPLRPFVSAGPSFSKLSGVGDAGSCLIKLTGATSCAGKVLKSSGTGIAFGAGLDMKIPVIRLAPEVRYTRLGANFFEGTAGASLASQRNQLEVLVGITF